MHKSHNNLFIDVLRLGLFGVFLFFSVSWSRLSYADPPTDAYKITTEEALNPLSIPEEKALGCVRQLSSYNSFYKTVADDKNRDKCLKNKDPSLDKNDNFRREKIAALYFYSQTGYKCINSLLRHKYKPPFTSSDFGCACYAKVVMMALKDPRLNYDKGDPTYFRGTTILKDDFKKLESGGSYCDPAFGSSSTKWGTAAKFARHCDDKTIPVVFTFKKLVPSIEECSFYDSAETERLLPAGACYKLSAPIDIANDPPILPVEVNFSF